MSDDSTTQQETKEATEATLTNERKSEVNTMKSLPQPDKQKLLLLSLIIIGALAYLAYNHYYQQPESTTPDSDVALPALNEPTEEFQVLADNLFKAAQEQDVDGAYQMFSSQLINTATKAQIKSLFAQLELAEALTQTQIAITDITVAHETGVHPGKAYVGLVEYSSPPNGTVEITFEQEDNQWKVKQFSFRRSLTAKSGNLDGDLNKIKQNIKFGIFKPTYLPTGYVYDGLVKLEKTNQNVPDGNAHYIVSLSYSDPTTKTVSGASKKLIFNQLNITISQDELATYLSSKLSPEQTSETVPVTGGQAVLVTGPIQGLNMTSLNLVKDNLALSLVVPSDALTKEELVRIANSLAPVL